jgi:FkbM family methyltransferase
MSGLSPKRVLKLLRTSQPFNAIATASVRTVLDAIGVKSEWVIRHVHRSGTVSSRLPNGRVLKLRSHGDDWVSNQVYWRGWDGYEPETTRVFFRLAELANVVVDVGAYVGFFSLLAARANDNSRVFAFEPLPAVHSRLESNIRLNQTSNIEPIKAAVGDSEGEADFFHLPDGLPTSSSLSREFMNHVTSHCSRVPVRCLDAFAREKELDRIDLIKIDAESTEPKVLSGAIEVLRRDRPNIICEVLAGRVDGWEIEAILKPLGYRYYLLTPTGPEPQDAIHGHPELLNYLFSSLEPIALSKLLNRQHS